MYVIDDFCRVFYLCRIIFKQCLIQAILKNHNVGELAMTATDRIYQKIKRFRRYVFERKDFDNYANYDQVGRALKQLVDKDI